jgi:hypothetical protein
MSGEEIPTLQISVGDVVESPNSGDWMTITHIDVNSIEVTQDDSQSSETVNEEYRVYRDECTGEQFDSREVSLSIRRKVGE